MPKAIFYLLKGDYKVQGSGLGLGFKVMGLGLGFLGSRFRVSRGCTRFGFVVDVQHPSVSGGWDICRDI